MRSAGELQSGGSRRHFEELACGLRADPGLRGTSRRRADDDGHDGEARPSGSRGRRRDDDERQRGLPAPRDARHHRRHAPPGDGRRRCRDRHREALRTRQRGHGPRRRQADREGLHPHPPRGAARRRLHRDHLATHTVSVQATWHAGEPVAAELGEPWRTPRLYYYKACKLDLPTVVIDTTAWQHKRFEALATQVSQHTLFRRSRDDLLAEAARLQEALPPASETFWIVPTNTLHDFLPLHP